MLPEVHSLDKYLLSTCYEKSLSRGQGHTSQQSKIHMGWGGWNWKLAPHSKNNGFYCTSECFQWILPAASHQFYTYFCYVPQTQVTLEFLTYTLVFLPEFQRKRRIKLNFMHTWLIQLLTCYHQHFYVHF